MAARLCFICGRPGTTSHPLSTCSVCGETICELHAQDCQGENCCPDDYISTCTTELGALTATIQDKIDNPPTLANFEDSEAELADIWADLLEVVAFIGSCCSNLRRLNKQTGQR